MADASSWRKRYPHPGKPPAKPDEREPITLERQDEWFQARHRWNDYVQKLRKHQMAVALDQLEVVREVGAMLSPEQVIAMNVAALVLDGSLIEEAATRAQVRR